MKFAMWFIGILLSASTITCLAGESPVRIEIGALSYHGNGCPSSSGELRSIDHGYSAEIGLFFRKLFLKAGPVTAERELTCDWKLQIRPSEGHHIQIERLDFAGVVDVAPKGRARIEVESWVDGMKEHRFEQRSFEASSVRNRKYFRRRLTAYEQGYCNQVLEVSARTSLSLKSAAPAKVAFAWEMGTRADSLEGAPFLIRVAMVPCIGVLSPPPKRE